MKEKVTDKQQLNLAGARTECARAHVGGISPERINVLIACEESQAECVAFRTLGFNAYSCDVQECRPGGHKEWHICGDVTPFLHGNVDFCTLDGKMHHVEKWHLIIAHPPCTYLTKVGSIWLYQEPLEPILIDGETRLMNKRRYQQMIEARDFFYECLNAKADFVAVENPIPMRMANLPKPSCYACPSWYGVKYTKKTLYWLKNLPPLMASYEFPNPKEFVYSSRGKYRSRTFPQLAMAIAKQWGDFILDEMNG